MNEESNTV